MDNNIPQPLFAPSSQQQAQADDFDLGEIFAEYFINEFDDPLNAYTSSMANYGGGAASVAMAQFDESAEASSKPSAAPMNLPTGGIKTTFHSGVHAPAPATVAPTPVAPTAPAVAVAPPAKKLKQETAVAPATVPAVSNQMMPAALPHPGMLTMQQQALPAAPQMGGPVVETAPAAQAGAHVALPVGVGIRLGGVGGIAPATAQTAARAPGVQGQYAWGTSNGGQSDQKAVAERRQRNREHAKRSRVRKKFMLESLQGEVRALQKENQALRLLIQEHIPEQAMKIISECSADNPLFVDPTEESSESQKREQTKLVKSDFSLMQSLSTGQQCFVLSDPKLPDNPIVFASPGFYKLTGYTSKEVLGRNCRFLQGPATDPRAVEVIRKAVATGSDATVCLLNYKADGTPFWNQFFIGALRDSDNCIVNYVGVQCEVEPEGGMSALEERVNQVLPLQNKEPGS